MDLDRYYELRTLLNTWKARLAEALRRKAEASPDAQRRMQTLYEQEGGSDSFSIWLDLWCRQAAIQWILRVLFLRVLEDRSLLGVERIRTSNGQSMWGQLTRNLGAASYLLWCCRDAAYLLPDLFGPTEFDFLLPDDDLIQRFFDDVWRRPDPNRTGWLRFDFRPDPDHADEGFQTRFIGDLYQELDSEIRERYALLQTPHFVAQFILEHTLVKRFKEKDFRTVTLIDPTCGSGHFLVDAFWMFVLQYEQALKRNREQLTVHERSKIARRIIEEHLFGCDINPYASTLARFRLTLAACDYARPASLQDLRSLRVNIVTIDSLIPYEKIIKDDAWGSTKGSTARILGKPEDIRKALLVLRRRYDVVVGNPPYIVPQDNLKKDLYRANYVSAYLKYGLSAPFTERFLTLLVPEGQMGMINSIAFTKRQFGKKLIENILPNFKVESIIDLSGAYIPGHGTPTMLLFVSNKDSSLNKVKFLGALKGEPQIPSDPTRGMVWNEIVNHIKEDYYDGEFVSISLLDQTDFSTHPWNFKLIEDNLVKRLILRSDKSLLDLSDLIGTSVITGQDDIFALEKDVARRFKIPFQYLRPYIFGSDIRDWTILQNHLVLFPYLENLNPIDIENEETIQHYLKNFKSQLASRTSLSGNSKWFELCRMKYAAHEDKRAISVVLVTTHNQFAYLPGHVLIQQGAPAIKFKDEYSDEIIPLIGILNSSVSCFFLKQHCYNKKPGNDPIRDNYEYTSVSIGKIPISRTFWIKLDIYKELAEQQIVLAKRMSDLSFTHIFESKEEGYHNWNTRFTPTIIDEFHPFTNFQELQWIYEQNCNTRKKLKCKMVFIQEELDWLSYEVYGIITTAPLAENYMSEREYKAAQLELGQRPFELAGKGYEGDWPAGYKPEPLPDFLRPLSDARVALIRSNPDIALLEDPLYKRRWIPNDYEQEFREAAEWWLAEKLEFALEQVGKPVSLREWARMLADDERVNAVLEMLTGSPAFDREAELLKVIKDNAVPNRPDHMFKLSGQRIFVNRTQNGEGAVPEYESKDFSDPVAWRVRGKLNIPRERFIAYREFDTNWRGETIPDSGGPWFGWAGWNSLQRADALANLLERANRAGWETNFRQCGLRAALRDLLVELKDLPPAERNEFEAIAAACGIGLETHCYCQAFHQAFKQGEPCAPGVSAEVLGLKPLEMENEKPRRGRHKAPDEATQLPLDL